MEREKQILEKGVRLHKSIPHPSTYLYWGLWHDYKSANVNKCD